MTLSFPLVSPIPIRTVGENAGSVIVCLVPGATPKVEPTTQKMSIVMTMSNPTLFDIGAFSSILMLTYKDGVCSLNGPPSSVIPMLLEGIKFTYDYHRDISKETILVEIHDGTAHTQQTLTFAHYDSLVNASIAAAANVTFTIGTPSPFPTITLQDHDSSGKSLAAVTILPEVPSAIESMSNDSAFGSRVSMNYITKAGNYQSTEVGNSSKRITITDNNVLSICFKGNVSRLNHALAATRFVAPQAISGRTELSFVIVISDDSGTIMSKRITLHGVPPPPSTDSVNQEEKEKEKEKENTAYPVYGTMHTSAVPPPPLNGVPYTIQLVNGTPTWVSTKQALPVNVAPSNKPTVAVLAPFTSTVSSDASSVENLRTVAAMTAPPAAPSAVPLPKESTFDTIMTILILIVCLGLFGVLGWAIYKDWSSA